MSKKSKAQVQSETPDRFLLLQNRHTVHPVHKTEWPQTGGTYVRNPDTGALAKQEPPSSDHTGVVRPVKEDLNHGT